MGTSSSSLSSLDSSLSADILIILPISRGIAYVQNVNKTAGFLARHHRATRSDLENEQPQTIQIAIECSITPRSSPPFLRAPSARAYNLLRSEKGATEARKEINLIRAECRGVQLRGERTYPSPRLSRVVCRLQVRYRACGERSD